MIRWNQAPAYVWKGYEYSPSVDADEDRMKVEHQTLSPDGDLILIPGSPYAWLTADAFIGEIERLRQCESSEQ